MCTTTRRPHNRRRAGAAGFTILETTVALVITMVIGLGAVSLFLFSINYNAGAADRARALAVAQQRMETLRAVSFNDLNAALAAANTGPVTTGSANAGEVDRRTFNVVTAIVDEPSSAAPLQKVITVTVTPAAAGRWTGGEVFLRTRRASPTVGEN